MGHKDDTTLRLDGYVRVSKVGGREGESFISPHVQAESLATWAQHHGHHLTVHEPELDRSGGTMDRPVFNRIMDRIATGQADGLLVFKVDRFARSLLGALTTLEAIAKAGGTFASVSDKIDMTTAQGRAFLHMQLVFAELFRDQVRDNFATATARAVARGVHITNVVPPGFDKGDDQRLTPNEAAPTLRQIFLRRASGEGASSLGRYLDHEMPRPNGEQWTPAHVRSLLSMRVYAGEAHYGLSRNPDAHQSIVTADEWQAAQNPRPRSTPRSGKTHLLAGLIRCAGCRYLMTPSRSGTGGATLTYRCRGKHTAGTCSEAATIVRSRIERYVEHEARALLASGRLRSGESSGEYDGAVVELSNARAELSRYNADAYARDLVGEDEWTTGLAARAERVRAAEQATSALSLGAALPGGVTAESWDALDTDERREALSQMVDVVFVRKLRGKPPVEDRAVILWRGDGPNDLPRRGAVNGPVRRFEWCERGAGVASGEDAR